MVFIYDGTYEGGLSCIFAIFNERITPTAIVAEAVYQPSLIDNTRIIITSDDWAARVLKKIDTLAGPRALSLMYKVFLSEQPSSEMLIYELVRGIVGKGNASLLENFANPVVMKAAQIEKMIHREVHRMHAFVRFQKSRDGLFCSAIDPDFNVLPLIGDHFERRYADQSWLIFDTRRHYGLYYDQEKMDFVDCDDPILERASFLLSDNHHQGLEPLGDELTDSREREYQVLWKNYFQSVNISERNNKKLHLRHMPRRYWKYLTEKNFV